ncbi:aspartyl-phosphate phosphatase Spo0E family protein [Cytobacillus depressus]|uniref:Aspartyl-phosphate phosphatase Spo0E family protein n=1 Tax=Cytobacillus depressus TaxID=1602942 RepID=A0A6L3V7G5_9BACI|nr:aspartyl-phosphate phosphatase Spo0E family protein [Cytobacillus depressus]KAB2337296.1 aspartyl-phosphate phosphatase Spo0E family protein [Cytobacillus depressus]
MGHICKKLLLQIQEKRENMINSANKYGYTSETTIRCSQELDQLIYEYQLNIHFKDKQNQETHYPFKKMFLVFPDEYNDRKYEIMT